MYRMFFFAIAHVIIKLYYEEVLDPIQRSTSKMQMLMEKTMEHIMKEHLIAFTKHLLICYPSLGPKFLQQI
jgi:hypothetical protein